MRLLDLRLITFGPFTDVTLDLSGGNAGLHLIHGPNEAGKSASLRALSGLLFGIPAGTSDNFVHDYRSLRIGGTLLHSDGSRLRMIRRKGNKDTLLDDSGAPLPESVLLKYLGGIDESLFSMMFGLTHAGLIQGGDEILRGGGVLGESIFTAGLGATHLREVLRELAGDAERIFKPKGSLQSIPQSLTAYKQARERTQAAALLPAEWAEEERALHEAVTARARLDEELRDLSAEKNRIDRLLKALPLLAERREILARRRSLGPTRILPPDFTKTRRELLLQRARLLEQEHSAGRNIAEIDSRLKVLQVPQLLMDHEAQIMHLHERLGGYRKAAREITRLQAERDQVILDAVSTLREVRPDLPLDQVERLRLTVGKRSRLRHLVAQSQALEERSRRSQGDVERLRARIKETADRLGGLPPPRCAASLRTALLEIRKQGSLEQDLAKVLAALRAGSEQANVELARLELFSGELSDLERLPVVSPETLDRFEISLEEARQAVSHARDRVRETARALSDVDLKIDSLRLGGPVPTETDLDEARKRRDDGWSLVRQAWLESRIDLAAQKAFDPGRPLPEAYEESVRLADGVSDRLRREAHRVAELAGLLAQRKHLLELERRCGLDLAAEEARLAALRSEWAFAWSESAIVPQPPKEMRAWITKREKLVSAAQSHRLLKDQADELIARIELCRARLLSRLSDLGEPLERGGESLDDLMDHCEAIVERIDAAARTRQELAQGLDTLARDLEEVERSAKSAEQELSRWREEWAEAMQDLGLEPATSVPEASAILERIEELLKRLDKAESLETRIQAAMKERRSFEDDARRLAAMLAPELVESPADQVTTELHVRFQKASKDAATRSELESQRVSRQEVQAAARRGLVETAHQLNGLCREAGCAGPEELEEAEGKSQQAIMLQKELDSVEKQLLALSGGATLDALAHEASLLDPDVLPGRRREIVERLERVEQERSEALEKLVRAEHNLQRMDGRAEAAEAADLAQGALARIREDANTYVRLRLAHAVLVSEIERYRAENQDPLVRRAGEIFSRLTQGSFADLQADYNEQDEPILVGVRPGGKHILVSGMSEGTRDQLFLSLRLASLERHVSRNEPMPFVVDDILVNFDDRRASAALHVLEEVSRLTQVILYTHHGHLVDLARRSVSPDALFIHDLTVGREIVRE